MALLTEGEFSSINELFRLMFQLVHSKKVMSYSFYFEQCTNVYIHKQLIY